MDRPIIDVCPLTGCASPLKEIKNPTVPFERSGYSILPPSGDGWSYLENSRVGRYDLAIGKRFEAKTHTAVETVTEITSYAAFQSPDEFLGFVTKSQHMDTDPRRFRIVTEERVLDDKFGDFSVRFYTKMEDHAPANKGSEEFLITEMYGYAFILPGNKDTIISIQYSERGVPGDIGKSLGEDARRFIDGVKIR